MKKTEINVQTGEVSETDFTPEEEAAAVAAAQADAASPARLLDAATAAAKTAAIADPVVQYLRNHTPAECEEYVQTQVTDLATAKTLLKKFAIVLCVLAKRL